MAEILWNPDGTPRPCMCHDCVWTRSAHERAEIYERALLERAETGIAGMDANGSPVQDEESEP